MNGQTPIERLRRDVAAAGLAHADRTPAVERLADKLGPELLAVVLVQLGCIDLDTLPLEARRNVA